MGVLLAFACAGFTARAQSLEEVARQGAVKEHEIQSASQKLGIELNAMIDEYQDNGLNGDEIKSLKSLKGILTRLSDKEMEKIVALLRNASESTDGKTTLDAIAQAYSKQKSVLVQLKQVLSAYAADQEAIELSENAAALADRQAANLQAGIETAQWSLVGVKPDEGTVDASLQAQAAEQKAIADESRLLQTKIAEFAKKSTNKEVAARFQKGTEDIVKIFPALDSASESLAGKKQFEAVGSEKTGRDRLRQLARTIAPPREISELLKEATEALDKLISEQEGSLTATKATVAKPIEQWLAIQIKPGPKGGLLLQLSRKPETAPLVSLPPEKLLQEEVIKKLYVNYVAQTKEPLTGLEDRQGDMANQADLLSQDLDTAAKPAADLLRTAIPPMQGARSAFNNKDSPGATMAQENALLAMKKAKASLTEQLAAAKKAEELAGDKTAQLEELLKQVKELEARQKALADKTAAPKTPDQAAAGIQEQGTLEEKSEQLQQQAKENTPAASDSLGAAATNMKQAGGAMKIPVQAPVAQGQQAQALVNLAKAEEELNKEVSKLADAQKTLDAAQKALADLAAIIEAEQKLQLDVVQTAPGQAKQPATVQALAPRQGGVLNDTITFGATQTTPDVQQPLTSATNHMGTAQGNLGRADARLAAPDVQWAITDLYAAKKAIEAQVKAADAALGTPPPADSAAAADAASAVAQAQAEVKKAMNDLSQKGTPESMQAAANDLTQAAATVQDATAQAQGLTPDANAAMQNAAAALATATGDAKADQQQGAKDATAKAQDALAQAAAALNAEQSGIADAGPPDAGQPDAGQPDPNAQPNGQGPPDPNAPKGPPDPNAPKGPPGPPNGPPQPGPPSEPDPLGSQGDGGAAHGGGQAHISKAKFLGLPERDRKAIQQAQAEPYSPQYAAKIEQYMQNLADESSRH